MTTRPSFLAAVLLATLSSAMTAHAAPADDAAGGVVVVEDESRQVAPVLASIFEEAGLRVNVVSWDDAAGGQELLDASDLVVLADARRLPTEIIDRAAALLQSSGKLMAIGAPAFGQPLIHTSNGYLALDEYDRVMYESFQKHPINLAANRWQRACLFPDRDALIEPGPLTSGNGAPRQNSATGWKITTDFAGWDNFGHDVAGSFASGDTLLSFKARGDGNTPQLYIECVEKDSSRWIAVVDLCGRLETYVLHPSDFRHWSDSGAKRGGAGDSFNPANVATMRIGLSRSHTPKCAEGPHEFWIGDLATAVDPAPSRHEFRVPEIEGLSPSYMLHPLMNVTSVRPAHQTAVGCLEVDSADPKGTPWAFEGYSPVWRNGGLGFDRRRPWRWVRLLDAFDRNGQNRGAPVSLMLGGTVMPGSIWANLAVADPGVLTTAGPESEVLRSLTVATVRSITRGCFLLEAGSRYFSCRPSEPIELGATVTNAGRTGRKLNVRFTLADAAGHSVFTETVSAIAPPGGHRSITRTWTPDKENTNRGPYTVTSELLSNEADRQIDSIAHEIGLLPDDPSRPEDCVGVDGSDFVLHGKPWYMLGINYYPSSQAGRTPLKHLDREFYDPAVAERDLDRLRSLGINTISGIPAPAPPDPNAPGAYRDLQDFLARCLDHEIRVVYFMHRANPLHGPNAEDFKRHIDLAGLKDHPAILAWDIAWEPIYHAGAGSRSVEFLTPAWHAWIVDRYGSLDSAEQDWDFRLGRVSRRTGKDEPPFEMAAVLEARCFRAHGEWDRAVAAFRRFFSDHVGQAYGQFIRQIRAHDPNHLVTFRFGACGIPDGPRFAHAHSASVAKHVDFLCPEGYNLQTGGWATPTPADDLRKGGLVTLFYRFLSREKPVVWMEFGYTVNGMAGPWKTGREQISPDELAVQRIEHEHFFQMFLESGVRGAAPWWFPGGYRVGEGSDFGVLEPDGSERPVCEVLRALLPKFADVNTGTCVAVAGNEKEGETVIDLDFDAHYADAWEFYASRYLDAVQSGHLPKLRTAGTNTTSANCPLTAVGNVPLSGHNPPQWLNAEFNSVEVRLSPGTDWQTVQPGQTVAVDLQARVECRVSVGNTAEATWLASTNGRSKELGVVHLGCQIGLPGTRLARPIIADTPYLADAQCESFDLPLGTSPRQPIILRMQTTRKQSDNSVTIPFGPSFRFLIDRQ